MNVSLFCMFSTIYVLLQRSVTGLQLVSSDKTITSSSNHSDWIANRAIDGDARRAPNVCDCCAATTYELNPWYKLDLGQSYMIHSISVLGRGGDNDGRNPGRQPGYGHTLLNMEIKLGTSSSDGNVLTTNTDDVYTFNYTLPTPTSGRYITLTLRDTTQYFVICELYVYAECGTNTYGDDCTQPCGNCLNNEKCDSVDGKCTSCAAGYQGDTCKQECNDGYFGSRCSRQCHCEGDPCNKETGVCPSGNCQPGYQESTCETRCNEGYFGQGCSSQCFCDGTTCNSTTGICPSGNCQPGYQEQKCDTVCNEGYFGQGCSSTCFCNGTTCDPVTGMCPSGNCQPGYQGEACDKTCDDGYYGDNCAIQCFCEGDPCNKVTGVCPSGRCQPGYQGSTCNKYCNGGYFGRNCSYQCFCDINTCDPITGICSPGNCQSGYQGEKCDSECEYGKYGHDCTTPCGHCLNGTACDKRNGTCPLMLCEADYEEHDCTVRREIKDAGSNQNLAGIAGGAAGGVVVLAVLAILAILLIRRRRKRDDLEGTSKSLFSPALQATLSRDAPSVNKQNLIDEKNTRQHTTKATKAAARDDDVYYEFLSKKTDLKLSQLWDYIYLKKKEDNLLFYQEYSHLKDGLQLPTEQAKKVRNAGKNRYRALYAYDHSRVPLEVDSGDEVDYINASFINGFEKQKKFIASQGPTEAMRTDFWRMVWQQKSKSIVMLTNLKEQGSDKCILYWPLDNEVTYGKITVSLLSEEKTGDYTIRHLEIYKDSKDDVLPVTQYHFQAWPDKSIPDSTWSLVKFWLKVIEDTKNATDSGPIVVHCSAGIGRTGTFIALDNAYNQAKSEGTVRVFDIVTELRRQRVNMVQTREQYVYLHEAVADTFLFGTHFIWSNQFNEVYEYLSQKDNKTRLSRLQMQYNLIVASIEEKKSVRSLRVEESDNEYSNVFIQKTENLVPIEEYRPKSKSLVYIQEVGALILQNHEEKDAFIICKSPKQSRMMEFWSLVQEQNVKTVVSVASTTSSSQKRSSQLGLENHTVMEKFGLSLVEERKTSTFIERKISMKDNVDDVAISHFEYTNWPHGDVIPKDTSSMVQFVETVLDRQRRLSETEPILVYCSNGFHRCGLMCILLSEMNRLSRDGGHINIVHAVKMMKERNGDIIGTFEEYKYIYDVILTHVRDSIYQNQ